MAKIIDFTAHRAPANDPPLTRNQQLLAKIQADLEARDTPEARLLSELRSMEETLLGNHRQYVRLWEAADRLGITPPVRTASQIVAEADGFPDGTPPLPPSLTPYAATPDPAHRAQFQRRDNTKDLDR